MANLIRSRAEEGSESSIIDEWKSYPSIRTLIRIMVDCPEISNGDHPIPTSYKRNASLQKWENLSTTQQKKLLAAWHNCSQDTKNKIRRSVNDDLSLSSAVSSSNWDANDWARLIHVSCDKKYAHLFTKTAVSDPFLFFLRVLQSLELLAIAFNDYINNIYYNPVYIFDDTGNKLPASGYESAFNICQDFDPTKVNRPPKTGTEINEKFNSLRWKYDQTYEVYKKKTDEDGDGDLNTIFFSKCGGDAKLLYCFLLWRDECTGYSSRSIPTDFSVDSGIIGQPDTFVSPKRKISSVDQSLTNSSTKKRIDSYMLLGKEISEGLVNAERINCATKMLIHVQRYGITEESRQQADQMLLQLAGQVIDNFGVQIPLPTSINLTDSITYLEDDFEESDEDNL